MTNSSEEPSHDARAETIKAAIEARLAEFDRHRDDLLAILQKACGRRAKPFDKKYAWHHIRLNAWCYLEGEARAEEKQLMVPAADRGELLRQLENALSRARCKLDEARHHVIFGVLFGEWCEAHGNPDFTDPIMGLYEAKFHEVLADVIAGLADLETAASRAAEQVRQKPGRPRGTGVLQHDFIVGLESAYRDITGKRGGAGPGPFAQFVTKFLQALERPSTEQSVIKAIKAAKKRKGQEWGQSIFAAIGGKTPPASP
jgi:hypothetical protein